MTDRSLRQQLIDAIADRNEYKRANLRLVDALHGIRSDASYFINAIAARDALLRSYRADHRLTCDKNHTCPCGLCQEAGTLLGDAAPDGRATER